MPDTAAIPVEATEAKQPSPPQAAPMGGDLAAIAVCSLIWGTTWYAITFQLGSGAAAVPPLVSLVYRFGSAALMLFAWLLVSRKPIALTRSQHIAVLLQGVFTFTINYAFVYFAEQRIVSAAVAVGFASMAFVNVVLFRIAFGVKAPRGAWVAAALGLIGVAVMSWAELARAHLDARAWVGFGFVFSGVICASIGNLFAHRAHDKGVEILPGTAWSMVYGAGFLALWAVLSGATWRFDPSPGYVGSLIYLAVIGTVVSFVLYFGLARRRGYTFASYISAITPPIAMGISAVFEHARWGVEAFLGVGLVIVGQILLIRARKA